MIATGNYWLFAAGVFLLMGLVAAATLRSGILLSTWDAGFNLLLSVPDNVLRCLLVVLCIIWGARVGPGPAALGWRMPPLRNDLVVGAAAGLLSAFIINLGGQLAVRRWGDGVHSEKLLQCIMPVNAREWAAVLLAFLPAVALEELLFRSLPLGGLNWLVPPEWLLWPLSLFFGLLHWPQGGWGVVGATLAAIVFSLLFLATGNIWAPLAAHYLLNIVQLIWARAAGIRPLRR